MLWIVVALLLAAHGWAIGDDASEHDAAFTSFLKIDVRSPRLGKDEPPWVGSGVLVNRDGYILTAAHLVKGAVERRDGRFGAVLVPGASIRADFVSDQLVPGTAGLPAELVAYSPEADVALLRLLVVPDDIDTHVLPVLDEDAGQEWCAGDCMFFLGYTGGETAEQASGYPLTPVDAASRRMVTANLDHGYSGGPVYWRDPRTNAWRLVGLTVAGLDRALTKEFVVLRGAAPLYNLARDGLAFGATRPFPSDAFLEWSEGDPTSLKVAEMETWLTARITDAGTAHTLAGWLFQEDLKTTTRRADVRTFLETIPGVVRKRVPLADRPPVLSAFVQRIVAFYDEIGVGAQACAPRMLEEVSAYFERCAQGQGGEPWLCWLDTTRREEVVWRRIIEPNFEASLKPGADNNQLGYWGQTRAEVLMEWGDALTKLLLPTEVPRTELETGQFVIPGALTFIDGGHDVPDADRAKSVRLPIGMAALDKFMEAYRGLGVMARRCRGCLPSRVSLTRLCTEITRGFDRSMQEATAVGASQLLARLANLRPKFRCTGGVASFRGGDQEVALSGGARGSDSGFP